MSWWPVHQFVEALVAQANLPVAGTPAWLALADDDPAKLLSLAAAGEHHVLRCEIGQELLAETAKDVAESVDCAAIARAIHRRNSGIYIPRKAS